MITNHGKVRNGRIGSQHNHAKILELGTGLDGWMGFCDDEELRLGAPE